MTHINSLDVELRHDKGKGASRRLRRHHDKVPGILYGGHKEPTAICVEQRLVRKALEDEGFYSRIITLNVQGQPEKVVLRDLQRHPYKPQILHIDFLRISATEKIHMHVPIHFIGEHDAPGLKDGGVLSKEIIETEVICLPADLPEFLEIDVSQMQMDESKHLADVKVPNGVELAILSKGDGHNPPIASLHRPKIVEDQEPVAAVETIADSTDEGSEAKPAAAGSSDKGREDKAKKEEKPKK
ncbi:MAG: rplY [Gammaproteobacteria bacterium]|jgi:large subunit ribosomal protein L25|nr:rplY [Gammaproteobacteria bacterium]